MNAANAADKLRLKAFSLQKHNLHLNVRARAGDVCTAETARELYFTAYSVTISDSFDERTPETTNGIKFISQDHRRVSSEGFAICTLVAPSVLTPSKLVRKNPKRTLNETHGGGRRDQRATDAAASINSIVLKASVHTPLLVKTSVGGGC